MKGKGFIALAFLVPPRYNDCMNTNQYTFDENILSDLHKDAYGIRPTEGFWDWWKLCHNDGKQEIWDRLLEDLRRANEEEKEALTRGIVEAEAEIRDQMTICGCTRRDAVRHLCDAYDCDGDIEHLEYMLRVPYGYFTKEFGRFFVKETV